MAVLAVMMIYFFGSVILFSVLVASLLWKFGKTSGHILLILLNLEVFVMLNLTILGLFISSEGVSFIFFFLFSTCAVCEACVGIGVLIKSVRWPSSDLVGVDL